MLSKELKIDKQITKQALIQELQSKVIKLSAGGAILGGERYNTNGSNKDITADGFWLGANGILKATNGEFSGKVSANTGTFNNVTIENNCIIKSDIENGVLIAKGAITTQPAQDIYTYSDLLAFVGGKSIMKTVPTGSFYQNGNLTNTRYTISAIQIRDTGGTTYVTFYRRDGTTQLFQYNYIGQNNPDKVWVHVGVSSGKTLRFLGLPVAGVVTGDVYVAEKDSIKYLAIK